MKRYVRGITGRRSPCDICRKCAMMPPRRLCQKGLGILFTASRVTRIFSGSQRNPALLATEVVPTHPVKQSDSRFAQALGANNSSRNGGGSSEASGDKAD